MTSKYLYLYLVYNSSLLSFHLHYTTDKDDGSKYKVSIKVQLSFK